MDVLFLVVLVVAYLIVALVLVVVILVAFVWYLTGCRGAFGCPLLVLFTVLVLLALVVVIFLAVETVFGRCSYGGLGRCGRRTVVL